MDRKYKVLDIQKWRFGVFLAKYRKNLMLSAIIIAEYGHFQHYSVIFAVMSLRSFSGCSPTSAGRPLLQAGLDIYGFAVLHSWEESREKIPYRFLKRFLNRFPKRFLRSLCLPQAGTIHCKNLLIKRATALTLIPRTAAS